MKVSTCEQITCIGHDTLSVSLSAFVIFIVSMELYKSIDILAAACNAISAFVSFT